MNTAKATILGLFVTILVSSVIWFSLKDQRQAGQSFRDCADCPEMMVIPMGAYFMGSVDGRSDEQPRHRVTVENDFSVGMYEVTRAQFTRFANSTNHAPTSGCETWGIPSFNMYLSKNWADPAFVQESNHPVVCVNWYDAQAYVNWLSVKTGEHYRLLSESEWEYVARAGTTTAYGFGDQIDATKANYGDEIRQTTTVGSYPNNGFGLYDMHGNAAEWVTDCLTDNYDSTPRNGAPMAGETCDKRVLRGGTWNNAAQYLRSAFRNGYFASFRFSSVGFRIARDL